MLTQWKNTDEWNRCLHLTVYVAMWLALFASLGSKCAGAIKQLTCPEKWVLQQVGLGKDADFNYYPENVALPIKHKQVNISARFLAALLSNTLPLEYRSKSDAQRIKRFRVHRYGIRIQNVWIICANQGQDADNNLENVDTGYYAEFQSCHFQHLDCSYSHFKNGLNITSSCFVGASDFSGLKIEGNLILQGNYWWDAVTFEGVEVTGGMDASGSQFLCRQLPKDAKKDPPFIYFRGLKVKGDAQFDDVEFMGPPSFIQAQIDGTFSVLRTKFNSTDNTTPDVFSTMKIGKHAIFSGAVFKGPVTLLRTDIGKNLDAIGSVFQNEADLTGVTVSDTIFVKDTSFGGPLRLNGVTYQYINATEKPEVQFHDSNGSDSTVSILKIVYSSEYSADILASLEASLRRQGYIEQADEVLVEHKRQERNHATKTKYKWPWFRNLLEDWLTLYGLQPHRTAYIGVILMLFGCFAFRARNMEHHDATQEFSSDVTVRRRYYNFLYSLDLMLPLVDLGFEKEWKPKETARFAVKYQEFHRIIGWFVVGLAALTAFVN